MICHVLPHTTADGPTQMARDHALLDAVDRDPGAAYFRTYQWSEPTLSLGYFQPWAEVAADPRWTGASVVRRPSGGGALWHEHDLTYALIVPRSHRAAGRPAALYHAVHESLAGLMRDCGIPARLRGRVEGRAIVRERPFLCFTDGHPEDIVVGVSKVVGSAQRRRPAAVLQHGSLLLDGSPRTPELRGLGDGAGIRVDALDWSRRFCGLVPGAIDLEPRGAAFPAAVELRAGELARTPYGDETWTRHR